MNRIMNRKVWQVLLPLSLFVAACHVGNTATTTPERSVAGPEPTIASLRNGPLADESMAARTTAGPTTDALAVSGTNYAVQNASAESLAAGAEQDVPEQARTAGGHEQN